MGFCIGLGLGEKKKRQWKAIKIQIILQITDNFVV